MGDPGGPLEGPPARDLGGVAQQRADVAGFPGGGGGAPHHGCGGQKLARSGSAHRPTPLALQPAEPTAAAAPAPLKSGYAGDGRAPMSQARGARGWRRTSAAGHPPNRAGPNDPGRSPHPPERKARRGPTAR